jgi:hypothetical protein
VSDQSLHIYIANQSSTATPSHLISQPRREAFSSRFAKKISLKNQLQISNREKMGSVARFLYKVADNVDRHPLPQPIKIFIGAGFIYGLSIYLVYSKPTTKPGHDIGSSEKPQAIRNETVRTLESEKRLLAQADNSKKIKS